MSSFVLVSCEVTVSNGPTVVGDEASDETLMESLGAKLVQAKCQSYKHYVTPRAPRLVMEDLDQMGYQLVGTSGIGQTLVWTFKR